MSLKLQPNPTFTAKVDITVPGQDKPARVEVTFRHLARSKIKDYFAHLEGKTDAEALGEIITDWAGIDEKYSQEALLELLENYPAAGGELFACFRTNLMESRQKN
jgi:hypothetical protein